MNTEIYTLTVEKLINLIIKEIKTNENHKHLKVSYEKLITNIDFLSKENFLLKNLDNSSRNIGNEILKCFPRDDFNKIHGNEQVIGNILVYHRSLLENVHDRVINANSLEDVTDMIKGNTGVISPSTQAMIIIQNGEIKHYKVKCIDKLGETLVLNKKENHAAFEISDKVWVEFEE